MTKYLATLVFVTTLVSGAYAAPGADELHKMFEGDTDPTFEPSAMVSLSKYGGDSHCTGFYQQLMRSFSNEARKGSAIASSTAFHAASVAATCAFVENKKGNSGNDAAYAFQVGAALGQGLLYDKVIEMTPKVSRAISYLEYAESNGIREGSTVLEKLRKQAMPTAGLNQSKPEYTFTADQVVAEYEGNNLAFKKKYEKKLLRVAGPISSILEGQGGEIRIELNGNSKKSLDEISLSEFVECRIKDEASKAKAMTVKTKQKVSLQGVYIPGQARLPGFERVILIDCKLM